MQTKKSLLIMIGAFPPPVHGMANVNEAVYQKLRTKIQTSIINIGAPSLRHSFWARLWRLPRIARGLGYVAFKPGLRSQTVYMALSGGLGQVYEVVFLLIARLRRMRIFLHHHSYAYLDHPTHLMSVLVRTAGTDARHIALSDGMATKLKTGYSASKVTFVSNAVLAVDGNDAERARGRKSVKMLGFLGNLGEEKGIFDFLGVLEAIGDIGIPLNGVIAGPFRDPTTEHNVRARLTSLPGVRYVGPQYGSDKEQFYQNIDVLIFPTRYKNEAEPLTIHEAMHHGAPVIAYARGAIAEIVDERCGCIIDADSDFVAAAVAQIKAWVADPKAFETTSLEATERYRRLRRDNEAEWERLGSEIASPAGGELPIRQKN